MKVFLKTLQMFSGRTKVPMIKVTSFDGLFVAAEPKELRACLGSKEKERAKAKTVEATRAGSVSDRPKARAEIKHILTTRESRSRPEILTKDMVKEARKPKAKAKAKAKAIRPRATPTKAKARKARTVTTKVLLARHPARPMSPRSRTLSPLSDLLLAK